MSWNYRVYRQKVNDDPGGEPYYYSVREAYYSPDNQGEEEPHSFSATPIAPVGDSLESLRWALEAMLKALDKPVLEQEDLDTKDET